MGLLAFVHPLPMLAPLFALTHEELLGRGGSYALMCRQQVSGFA
ncbi:hypothetical protein [Streptomyces sp. SID3343]|nr:hypothetical protein [Streptomyces sp. SID3343]